MAHCGNDMWCIKRQNVAHFFKHSSFCVFRAFQRHRREVHKPFQKATLPLSYFTLVVGTLCLSHSLYACPYPISISLTLIIPSQDVYLSQNYLPLLLSHPHTHKIFQYFSNRCYHDDFRIMLACTIYDFVRLFVHKSDGTIFVSSVKIKKMVSIMFPPVDSLRRLIRFAG